jgi:hypothetical protein
MGAWFDGILVYNTQMEKRESNRGKPGRKVNRDARSGRVRQSSSNPHNQDFRCENCQSPVSANAYLAGVQNRNHCPYCLWSKHVDSKEAGDRLAACKGQMRPVGLTLKKTRKKYGPETGELMLIHQCKECAKFSINRIAADDINSRVIEVFKSSFNLDPEIKARLEEQDIHLLTEQDASEVHTQLYGNAGEDE